MKITLFFLVCSCFLFIACEAIGSHSERQAPMVTIAPATQITSYGIAFAKFQRTKYSTVFIITKTAVSASSAYGLLSAAVNSVVNILRRNRVTDWSSVNYRLYSNYEFREGRNVFTGFTASQSVQFFASPSEASTVADSIKDLVDLIYSDFQRINQSQYYSASLDAQDEATQDAFRRARKTLASFNYCISSIASITVSPFVAPAFPSPVEQGQQSQPRVLAPQATRAVPNELEIAAYSTVTFNIAPCAHQSQ